jgi:hypothetical protein
VLPVLLLISIAWASDAVIPPVSSVWVQAETPADKTTLQGLGLGWAEGHEAGWWRMDAGPDELARLEESGLSWRHQAAALAPAEAYLEPEDMVAAMEALASAHPDRVSLIELGWSVEGRPIVGVRISRTDTPRGHWRILGAHHGDETSSAELARHTAGALASTTDPEVLAVLDHFAVWIIPHVNPDGVAAHTRYNVNMVDLNRNYAYEWSPGEFGSGPQPFSEPETQNIRGLSGWVQFGAGLSMHAGATNIGWVWNYTTSPTVDASLLEALAGAYGEDCSQPGFYLTNGAEWYITHGDTNDWAYGYFGTLDYTLEVTDRKSPGERSMEEALDHHLPGVLAFLSWPWHLQGTVRDTETGRAIPATLQSPGILWDFTSGPDGRFSRPAMSGSTTVSAAAPGYEPVTVDLSADGSDPIDIALTPSDLSSLRPVPRLLSRWGDGWFGIDVDASAVTLTRPGEPPVSAVANGDGWVVDPSSMTPGPWSIDIDGAVAPRTLFIGEVDDAVRITASEANEDDGLVLTGSGFGRGSRVWALWGTDRALVPLTVTDESTTTITLAGGWTPEVSEPIDLVLFTNGRQLALVDVLNGAVVDTGSPRADTGAADDSGGFPLDTSDPEDSSTGTDEIPSEIDDDLEETVAKPLGCGGCSTSSRYPIGWALVTLLAFPGLRRRP